MEDAVYPGSSQFGLDERFVDADSSPIVLDFDEDIFTGKLGSPVVRPPSPPVLKEDIPPSMTGHGDGAVRMEIDDRHEPSTPIFNIDMTERGTPGLEHVRADQHQNVSLLSPPLIPLDESVMPRASSKDPDLFLAGDAMPSFNALVTHTQQVFEARTPDLNKEFCPPDEPSTPALPEETSLPFEQELPLISGSQERFFPGNLGGVERARPNEQLYMIPPSNQVSVVIPLGQSRQDVVVPAQSSSPMVEQHFSLLFGSEQSNAAMDPQQVNMAPQRQLNNIFVPQNATSSFPDQSFRSNPVQQASVEANINASSAAFQGFHVPSSVQQLTAGLYRQSGQDITVPARFSLPMIDQHCSPSTGSEQSMAAVYPPQASMASQAQLSSMLTSQNASSSFLNQSFGLSPVEHASSVEMNRDAIPAPFQGFPLSTSMQQLTAGSYRQSKQDLCVPAQVCSPIIEQSFTPFVDLEQSNTAMYPQQANMLSQPHFSSMSIAQKATSSFTDQSSVVNPVQKASPVEPVRDFISAPFQGFPLPASLQQFMTGSYQNISLGTSNYLAPLAATNANHSMASLHQTFGSSSVALNHPWSPSMSNHGASSVFQQPGLLVNPKMMLPMATSNSATSVNHALASSIGTAESSSIFRPHGTLWDQRVNITDSIQKNFQSTPIANNLPSSLTSSGSFSPPAQESSMMAQTEGSVLNTEINKSSLSQELAFTKENIISAAAQRQMAIQGTHEVAVINETILPATTQHFVTSPANSLAFSLPSISGIENDQERVTIKGTQEPGASKGILPPPVALHDVGSSAVILPSSLPSVCEREEGHRKTVLHMSDIPQHETLRSTAEVLREKPDFFIVSKDPTSAKISAIALDRNNAHPAKTNENLKELIHPALDKTPSLRGETPITATKRSPFSTHSFDSVPGDDDVLATILGRGTSAFKVLPTPKEHPVAKRPRVALRSSFKKRKIEFDILTVLHGDVIRQQLANTEDIRRVRKKAPCTWREIWSLNREIQGQQIFCEPSLPGLSPSLHDLYGIVLSVSGAKLPSADLLETPQGLPVVEPEISKLDIEDRCRDSGVLILEGFKENNLSDFQSEAICTPEKVLLEETVTCVRRDDELNPEIVKESLNRTLHSEGLCLPLQDSEELAVRIGSAQEQNPVSEAAPVHIIPLDMEATNSVLQNGSQGLEDLYLQGSTFRGREESIDAVEQKAAEQVVMKKDVGHGLVDSLICNLMDAGKEGNMLEGETNREIEVMNLQGDIRGKTQGLVIYSEEEMQGPETDAQRAQDLVSFGTDVLSRQVDLQGDIRRETQGLVIYSEEETQRLGTDAQRAQDFGSFGTDVLSRQVNLQGDKIGETQGLVVYSEGEMQGPGPDAQCAQDFGSFGTDVLTRQVDLQGDIRGETQGLVIYSEQETQGPGTDAQCAQDFGSFGTDAVSRQVDLQSLQTTPGAEQDVLSRQVDLHSLQTTPATKEDVLSRQVDLGSSQTTPSAEQDVGEGPSLSNTAMDEKGDDKEMIGDTFEERVDASKEDKEFGFISDAKDTDFLAADDDMAFDEVDDFADFASDEQDSSIHDKNGWSVRTRNVGRYLKTVFEGMEGNCKRSEEQGHPKLGLGRLLMGKTRKEAARMFFETLVLKTRDYIHVDQKSAFEDIHLYPKPKLMKTRF